MPQDQKQQTCSPLAMQLLARSMARQAKQEPDEAMSGMKMAQARVLNAQAQVNAANKNRA